MPDFHDYIEVMSTVAIQGNAGSFHDQAAQQFFNDKYEMLSCSSFRDVFDAVYNEKVDFGIVAIENSLHGSINPVYRLLSEHGLWVCGEVRIHIRLYLIGQTNLKARLNKIDTVISQAEAISQCELWLQENISHAKIIEYDDTAGSVQHVIENKLQNSAAIASKESAEIYKAEVLAGPINDDPANYTRFFILTKNHMEVPGANRTSIIMTENDHDNPGTLYDALGVFKELGINLSKLDSHTLPGKKRRYAFYVDFDENYSSLKGQKAIQLICKLGWDVDVLGSYKKSEH